MIAALALAIALAALALAGWVALGRPRAIRNRQRAIWSTHRKVRPLVFHLFL